MPTSNVHGLEFDGEFEGSTVEGVYDDVSGLQDDIDAELSQILTDFDGGEMNDTLEVRVYRPMEGKGKVAYVFSCLPTELPILDRLRDEYDGGDFEVRLLKNKKIFRKFQVCVEKPVRRPNSGGSTEMSSLAGAMTQGFSRLGELMVQINSQQNQAQPPVDMMAMQTSMTQNMLAMKELVGTPQRQPSPISQMKELMELKALMSGDTVEKEAGTNDVLVSLINGVMPALVTMGQNERALTPTKRVKRNPTEKVITPEDKKVTEQTKAMKMQLMYLCGMAKKDVDPAPYANMVLDNTPDENVDALVEFISDENAIENMTKVHADVGNYKEWFKELGANVVELVSSWTEDDLTTEEDFATINESDSSVKGSHVRTEAHTEGGGEPKTSETDEGHRDAVVSPVGESGRADDPQKDVSAG